MTIMTDKSEQGAEEIAKLIGQLPKLKVNAQEHNAPVDGDNLIIITTDALVQIGLSNEVIGELLRAKVAGRHGGGSQTCGVRF